MCTVSNLAWSTPEGRPVLSHLDLSFGSEGTGLAGRNGVGKSTLLKLIAAELQPLARTVALNGTLGVLRQAAQVDPTETVADLFKVTDGLALLARAETGEADAEALARADWTLEARLAEALGRLELDVSPKTRLATLPGGQAGRKVARAMHRSPETWWRCRTGLRRRIEDVAGQREIHDRRPPAQHERPLGEMPVDDAEGVVHSLGEIGHQRRMPRLGGADVEEAV